MEAPRALMLLKRGERHALRLKDNAGPGRAAFSGLRWFPVDPSWKVTAKFVPVELPTRLVFDTIVGETESVESPGVVEFERDGQRYQLQAALEDGKLWFVFRDATSGRTTHANARQLLADPPGPDGSLILDFNRARNLPCAYTPFATCPIAPPKNRLALAVTAGEQKYEPALKK
ncbi:MAG: DUF1684 domain-containing protein [Isosphaeraceae bacterium]